MIVMRFAPPDDEVELYKTVFDEDILGRKKVSEQLSALVERIEDPLVIALDGRWGTGKSYFLKRWVGAHTEQNDGSALTVYFDAFAHDYLSDPLIALVGALSNRAPKTDEPKLNRIKAAAAKFIKPALRIGLAIGTAGATTVLNEAGDAIAEAIGSEADRALEEFWKKEEGRAAAMDEFRRAIAMLTKFDDGSEKSRPLVIVVDDLDRCRPDFALEVLEVIKHFFAVPYVHFILGVNLYALENSVHSRYGAEIDASAYLQKFLSIEMQLPAHAGDPRHTKVPIKYLEVTAKKMNVSDHILDEVRTQIEMLLPRNHISIRDVGKILSSSALLPEQIQQGRIFLSAKFLIFNLLITRIIRPDLFRAMIESRIDAADLEDYFGGEDTYFREYLPGGAFNPNFDRKIQYRLKVWNYVIRGDGPENHGVDQKIAGELEEFLQREHPNRLPAIFNERFLRYFDLA